MPRQTLKRVMPTEVRTGNRYRFTFHIDDLICSNVGIVATRQYIGGSGISYYTRAGHQLGTAWGDGKNIVITLLEHRDKKTERTLFDD